MATGISPTTNRIVNVIVCVGAAIVLVGALFKLQHWKGSDILLPVGLFTEAGIFLVYALLPPPDTGTPQAVVANVGNPAIKAMENMLKDADITPESMGKLSAGFQKLGTTVNNMSDIGEAVNAVGDYTKKTKEATQALTTVKDAYMNSANAMSYLNNASESTKLFHEQVQTLTKNLSSLNTIYELELNESNNHLKALNQFYGRLAETSNVMEGSADSASKVKVQIASLADNLGKLNQVYGNMLTAMHGGR